ncbi:MAG TPA: Arm DNA-binding domain-containing protein, partial [Hyphomicrobiaceae bacterium]|nr:Arm DNA-binding domain-containing protein [Hyphomicrobiaceae bacterium]
MAKNKANAKTAKAVEALMKPGTKPGRYSAGSNLYLLVGKADGQRSWTWVYRWHGKLTACGLGSAFEVALGDARKAANACRAQLDAGIKPGSPEGTEPGKAPTFGEIADQVIAAKAKGWKGDGSHKRWVYALSRRRDDDGKIDGSGFCQKLVNRPVNMVTTQDVVDVLAPIWLTKRKSASLLRVQIEAVLGAATALNHRQGDNPATLARLKDLLPTQDTSVKHHAAHPYQTAPAFV